MKVTPINSFFKKENKETINEVIAELVALDGLNFNQLTSSRLLQKTFKAVGYEWPKCPNTAKKYFMAEYNKCAKIVTEELAGLIKQGTRFSVSFDESTSVRNRRFMSVNINDDSKIWSLGMVRVKGSMNADKAGKLVEGRLEKFGLNMPRHIVGAETDGASVMIKFGKQSRVLHSVCWAHAIHLCVMDVLYKKEKQKVSTHDIEEDNDNPVEVSKNEDIEDEDIENEDRGDEEQEVNLIPKFQETIKKVRKTVKIFRQSPVKNDDNLQVHVFASHGKELQLYLDVCTRWNSLLKMLERFYELRKELKIAVLEQDNEFDFTENEINNIKELCGVMP